jgi:RND superfamily putative drug exporter
LTSFFAALATRAPRKTLVATVTVAIAAGVIGLGTPDRLANSETEFFSRGTQSYETTERLAAHVGAKAFPNISIIFPARGPVGLRALADLQRVASLVPLVFHSRDHQAVARLGYIHPQLSTGPAAARLAALLHHLPGVSVGGAALARQQFTAQAKHDFLMAEVIVLPLVLALAFIVFRSAVAALLPVLVGGFTINATLVGLRAINAIYPLSILSLNVTVGIGLGLSLDYSLLLVARYREELAQSSDPKRAARISTLTAGRTVLISSTTVGAAFAALMVFPIDYLRSVAISGMLASITAGVASVVVLPAVFTTLGDRINALAPRQLRRSAERTAQASDRGFWYRLARFVINRPVVVALTASLVLLAISTPLLGIRLAGFEAVSQAEGAGLHRFEERLKTEFSHPPLDNIVILAHADRQTLSAILSHIRQLRNVAIGEVDRIASASWLISLNGTSGLYSSTSKRLIARIRSMPYHLGVTGLTAEFVDTTASIRSHLLLALTILLTTTLVFLFIATGSAILPFKAIAMNALSLAATFGVLVFIFQDGRFKGLLNYTGLGAIFLIQPLMICTATFGVLTDYSVFMLTRIKEGWDAGLPNSEAIALGVERTGRIITAAALLFCVAVGALVTGRLIFLKEAGFGLAVAIAIDATIVRAFLVPSLMTLLGSWNWWPNASTRTLRTESVISGTEDR